MYQMHPDFKPHKPVTFEQLQAIMDAPVLDTSLLPEPYPFTAGIRRGF